ncbi:MAG: glycosyltransferase family 1 protein [Deltaproteobacteria bacterium]|nr:glycosyltransferase family 1 protein [Deltaproteobacteria bacterium]
MSNFLESNLTALHAHQPHVVERLLAAEPDSRYQATQNNAGEWVIVRKDPLGLTALSPIDNAAQVAATFAANHVAAAGKQSPPLLLGMRAGYEILACLEAQPPVDGGPKTPVYIVEPTMDVFRLNMAAHDFADAIASGRLYFFIGPEAGNDLEAFFTGDLAKPFPDRVLPLGAFDAGALLESMRRAKTQVTNITGRRKVEIDAYYDALDARTMMSRFLTPGGLKTMIISNRHSYFIQYSVRDIRMALEAMGGTVRVIEEATPVDRLNGAWLLAELDEFRPDWLIFVDHLRGEYAKIYPKNLPFVCWAQDHMPSIHTRPSIRLLGRRDLCVGFTRSLETVGMAPERLFELPPLTNPEIYAESDDAGNGEHDVAFVSNISKDAREGAVTMVQRYREGKPEIADALQDFVDELLARLECGEDLPSFDTIYREIKSAFEARKFGAHVNDNLVVEIFDNIVGAASRHRAIETLAAKTDKIGLYGRRWDAHPKLSKFARGVIDNGPELARLFAETPINLHVNQYQLEHPRLVDGLMAGGFFLARRAPSIGLLEMDECLFDDEKQLAALFDRYAADEELRGEVVARQQEIIREWATYDVGLTRALTYFAALLLDEYLCTVDDDHLRELVISVAASVDAEYDDPRRRDLALLQAMMARVVTTTPIQAGVLAVKIARLDAYHDRFGASTWPRALSAEAIARVSVAVDAAWKSPDDTRVSNGLSLMQSWLAGEDGAQFAYRHRRDGVRRRTDLSAFRRDRRMAIYTRHHRPNMERHRVLTAEAMKQHKLPETDLYVDVIRLLQKGWPQRAFQVVDRAINERDLTGYPLRLALECALRCWDAEAAQRSWERLSDWMKSSPRGTVTQKSFRMLKDYENRMAEVATARAAFEDDPCAFEDMAGDFIRSVHNWMHFRVYVLHSESQRVRVWDRENSKWVDLGIVFDASTPLAVTREGLYVVDAEPPQTVRFGRGFRKWETIPLPDRRIDFIEDIAVHPNGRMALVDSYESVVWVRELDGLWTAQDVHDMVDVEADEKVATLGPEWFADIYTMERPIRIDVAGGGFEINYGPAKRALRKGQGSWRTAGSL